MRGAGARACAALLLAGGLVAQPEPAWPARVASFQVPGGTAHAVAFAPNGSAFASGGGTGDLILWDRRTLEPRWRVQASDHWIGSVAFAPDGRSLLAVGRELTVWSLDGGKRFSHPAGGPRGAAYSHDGRRIALHRGKGVVALLDADSGELLRSFAAPEGEKRYPVNCIAFSHDDRRIYTGDNVGTVREMVLDTGSERVLFSHREDSGHAHSIELQVVRDRWMSAASNGDVRVGEVRIDAGEDLHAATLTADGQHVITGHGDGALRTWSADTGELVAEAAVDDGIVDLELDATGESTVVATSSGRIVLQRDGATEAEVDAHPSEVKHLAWSADGAYVVAAGARTVFYEVTTGRRHAVPGALAVAPGIRGPQVFTRGKLPLTLVDARSGEVLRELPAENRARALDPTGRLLVLGGGWLSKPQLLDLETETAVEIDRFERVLDAAWSPNGALWAIGTVSGNHGESGGLWVHDRDGALVFDLRFACAVSTVAFAPDGETLVYAKGGGSLDERVPDTLHVLEVPGFRERQRIDRAVEWWRFLDNRNAVAHDYHRLMLWDTTTMTVQREVAWPDLRHAALSPDRQLAALADRRTHTVTIVRVSPPR